MTSEASAMARAMHQFMVNASAGMFRARFAVPPFDWPSILEDGETVYDSVSSVFNDNYGRARLGGGVLVMELAGPNSRLRLLCVTAETSLAFVTVLHRLLIGFSGSDENVSTIRLLISQVDFEAASRRNGRSGLQATLDELQCTTRARIGESFQLFERYPLAGKAAMRLTGRPFEVLLCVCRVNEILYEMTTATIAIRYLNYDLERDRENIRALLASEEQRLWRMPDDFPEIDFQWQTPPEETFNPPFTRLQLPHSPQTSTTENSADGATAVDTRRRMVSKVPSSVTTTTTTVTPRTTITTTTANPRTTITTTTANSRTVTSARGTSNSHINQSSRHAVLAATRPTASTRSVSDRLAKRDPSQNSAAVNTTAAATRPIASTWSVSDRLAKKDPSQTLAVGNTTTVTTRSNTSARSVSDRLLNRNLSSRVTNTTGTPVRSVSDRLIVNRKQPPSSATTNVTSTTAISTTATTTTTVNHRNSATNLMAMDSTDMSIELSSLREILDATDTVSIPNVISPPIQSVSDLLNINRRQSPSSITTSVTNAIVASTTATATTAAHLLENVRRDYPYFYASMEAYKAINGNTTSVRSVSDGLVNGNPSPRVSTKTNDTTANTSSTSTTSTTTDISLDISTGKSGDSSESDHA